MWKPFLIAFFCCALIAEAAEPLWVETFDAASGKWPAELRTTAPGRGGVLHISVPAAAPRPGRTVALPLPLDKLAGNRVFFSADVKATNISAKPNSWNGIKAMMVIEAPSGKTYPQPDIPTGTFDWQRFSSWVAVPAEATNVLLVLGLENVSGEASFDNVRVTPKSTLRSARKADPSAPVFRGHKLPRLRGAMAGTSLNEEDVSYFARVWNGNLLRLQIFESARHDRPLEAYDSWLEERLRHIDVVLSWCEKYGIMAVLDLHSPPGGQAFSAGYITARGRIFTDPKAQAKFVGVWQTMASRYKGRKVIWGFDLVNEPDDSMQAEDCLDWNSLADKTARAVRAIDPDRTLIVEPNQWGGAQGFIGFEPLDLPGVVYSFHFYQPMQFTHQGIHGNPAGVAYPGTIGKEQWDQAALERAMGPAVEFARKHRVHMYVGEFSAIRTAPDESAAKYLADLIGILEKHGYDWSYHAYREWQGWSLEHAGPLDKPAKTSAQTDREKVVTGWLKQNGKS